MLYTLLLRFNTPEQNLTECELKMFLVLTNYSVCSDNTKSRLALKISILTVVREMPRARGKSHDKMGQFVSNKAKGRISKRRFQENKARQIS